MTIKSKLIDKKISACIRDDFSVFCHVSTTQIVISARNTERGEDPKPSLCRGTEGLGN